MSENSSAIESSAMHKFSYGLFVLTACENGRDNGCIINTAIQVADNPKRISIAVNKANHTHDMIVNTGSFNISVLTESASFDLFQRFGFQSGRDADKFAGYAHTLRTANGILAVTESVNAFMSAKVTDVIDCGTHSLFIAEVTEAKTLSKEPSVTYSYYFAHIKPKPQAEKKKKGYVCKICGYIYEGDELPEDYICPVCKHPAEDFEPLQ